MSRANALAFCDSRPRTHRIRVTTGSRLGELARTKRIARARCIGTAPIAVRGYSNVTLDFPKGVVAVNLKYFNPLGCLYSSAHIFSSPGTLCARNICEARKLRH